MQGGGGFIILCSTQSNTGPLNREQRWRIILGAFSRFLPPPSHPPPPPPLPISPRLFFLRCMSAIHLSAVSISETSAELSLGVAPAFGGPCAAAALQRTAPYGSSEGPPSKQSKLVRWRRLVPIQLSILRKTDANSPDDHRSDRNNSPLGITPAI